MIKIKEIIMENKEIFITPVVPGMLNISIARVKKLRKKTNLNTLTLKEKKI
jgi:hypothetical protein